MTKADDTRQLSPAQLAAIPLLLAGQSITDVAAAVGVARQTVSTWVNADAAFIAAVNAERLDLWEGHKDRLRSLVPKALDVLARGLDHADPRVSLAAARDVLKSVSLADCRPDPATTEEDVRLNLEGKAADRCKRRSANVLDSIAVFQ